MKKVFTCPTRMSVQFSREGIYAVLPFREPDQVDSIISWTGRSMLWIYEPRDSWKIYTSDGGIEKGLSKTDFLDKLRIWHPKDLTFFLWYPESLEGDWTAGEIKYDRS